VLSCREVTRLSSEASERKLSLLERLSLWRHTLACSGCRNFRLQINFIRRATERYRSGRLEDEGD
jgi:hypothetical protein